ncbi:pseudaminic acid synthase [Tsuneonella amylolytica]|uniref:pseudaminic acid synthase n=1 Tax=Tsuneonella amylolytica TaxID=2338327 RepID=UPI000EA9F9B4|nr:pseudaminic acid synthase [Tsuneonella amylolytica]
MTPFQIEDFTIDTYAPPLVIAEVSANHNHSLDRALEIVDAAAAAGANAIKLQTYTADTMTIDHSEGEFFISDPNSLWNGTSLYDLYKEAYTPWEWHKPIFDRCREHGMIGFSTPFDPTAVDFLEDLGVPCHKIASFENVDLPLIAKVARTGKPMIMSTGMATAAEIDEAVRTARENGCENLILLKCTSSYPADPASSNLLTIPHLREMFGCHTGLSDHTMGIGAAVAATALGAVAIEKHLTIAREDGGVDSAFSMEPDELAALVRETRTAAAARGTVSYGPSEAEKGSLVFRRSIYVVEDVAAGEELTETNLRLIRPGLGLAPKHYADLVGKRVSRDVKRGTPASWDLIG